MVDVLRNELPKASGGNCGGLLRRRMEIWRYAIVDCISSLKRMQESKVGE